jgi:hypothetical protein
MITLSVYTRTLRSDTRIHSALFFGNLRSFSRSLILRDDSSGGEDQPAARQWLAKFNTNSIPRNLCEVSFSRSSGPGGQNVNKWEHLHVHLIFSNTSLQN